MITTAFKLFFAYSRWGKLSSDDIRVIKTTTFIQLLQAPYIITKYSSKNQSLAYYTPVLRTGAPQ